MDATHYCMPSTPADASPRCRAASRLQQADRLGYWWQSPQAVAHTLGVPVSTFHYWQRERRHRRQNAQAPLPLVDFCESPEGIRFLRRLLLAAHLIFVQAHDCGLRSLGRFLELSGLDEFIAPSYGAQQSLAETLEQLLIEFGQEEQSRLAAQMTPREITVAEDETFHPQICLVAIEPVSDFLLLEEYVSQRDAVTWQHSLDVGLAGLPVTVIQIVSDEAPALISQAHTLQVQHSPDLFHVQQETSKATSAALASQVRRAERTLAECEQHTAACQQERDACQQQCPQSSQGTALAEQLRQQEAKEQAARQRLAACREREQQAAAARRGLSHDYHPIDLETGRPLTAEEVTQRLTGHFDQLDQVAEAAGLSGSARAKLAKARRVLDAMTATLVFFWTTIGARLTTWNLSPELAAWLREELLPGLYLQRAARKAGTAEERARLTGLADTILARARSRDGPWGRLDAATQADLEVKLSWCADLFQRSSSCVEGRNGQLSLKHHGLHRLTARKLGALRVLHNYFLERDEQTPAERFFGAAPRNLMDWLEPRFPDPPRARPHRES